MSVNVSREADQVLNIDHSNEGANSNIKINNSPGNDLSFIMNEDAAGMSDGNSGGSGGDNAFDDHAYDDSVADDMCDPEDSIPDYNGGVGGGFNRNFEDIEKEKAKFLSKLYRLSQNPQLTCRNLTYEHSLEEIKSEVFRCEKDLEIIQGVTMYRTMLMFTSQSMEYGADKMLGFENMQGWSSMVTRDINSNNYDQVLEEIYEIWGGAAIMRPELRLIMMLGSSAVNYNINKSMANHTRSFMSRGEKPSMRGPAEDTDDILKQLDESDSSSVASEVKPPAPKKRGRKKKNT